MVARRWRLGLIVWASLASGAPTLAADDRVPRTPAGVPDLSGVWTNAWLTKMERPKEFKTLDVPEAEAAKFNKENAGRVKPPMDPVGQESSEWPEVGDQLARIRGVVRSSWIYDPADGKIPYTSDGRAANKATMDAANAADHPEERTLADRCLYVRQAGPPLTNGPDLNVYQIVQTPDHVVLVSESNQTPRVIRLGARHDPKSPRRWMGDSVGRWEGGTLVVETINFHPGQLRSKTDVMAAHRVVERFTRTGANEIHYAFTVENPAIYTQRWRGEMILRPANGRMFEYACHEGNYALANILAGGRTAEREAAEQAKAQATPAAVSGR